MQWRPGDRSNIEDMRGRSGGRAVPIGIGGVVLLALLSWATGTDFLSMVTDWIVIGLTGRSPGFDVAVPPIFFTTSIPSVTSPNTLCLLSSHGVGASVMKNWPPLVFGPELAIDSTPAFSWRRFGWNSSANL